MTSSQLRKAALYSSQTTVETYREPDQAIAGTPTTITALPLSVTLVVYAGDDFYVDVEVTNPDDSPMDLSDCTATAQIRISAEDNTIAGTFDCSIVGNVITLHLSHDDSATIGDKNVWDCQIVNGAGDVTTLVAGTISTTPEVTRP